ncbi:hypothetical protein BGZ73_005645 [Actinomortierella ambigua]|nr:hypothetical protein BGZ73_005645 [Actinomortierella ambigua]
MKADQHHNLALNMMDSPTDVITGLFKAPYLTTFLVLLGEPDCHNVRMDTRNKIAFHGTDLKPIFTSHKRPS